VRSVLVVGPREKAATLADEARSSGLQVSGQPVTPEAVTAGEVSLAGADSVLVSEGLAREALAQLVLFVTDRGLSVWMEASASPDLSDALPIAALGERAGVMLSRRRGVAAARRAVDIAVAGTAIVALLPLLALLGLLVKLSSRGPALHRAVVVGEDGRPFTWYKFRTMRTEGEDEDWRRRQFAQYVEGGRAPAKIVDASRVTAVGRVLRRHSLDELPQLFSVLRGDMTLIGPRPCLVYEYELLKPWHRRRFAVRPGLTGLWQVRGRGVVHADDMAFMDIFYSLGRTWRTDLRLLWDTLRVALTGRGAV